jgi:hypothetical protein
METLPVPLESVGLILAGPTRADCVRHSLTYVFRAF